MAKPLREISLSGVKKDTAGNLLAAGQVFAYTPGTTVQAPVYGDEDQLSILSQPLILDSQGRYQTVYTEGIVDLYFHDSDGTFLFRVDRANSESAVEVEIENSGWNGVLADGSTGPGGRCSVDDMATRLKDSLGGTDGKYLPADGGTARPYNVVVTEIGLSVMNKGAAGNDSANDTAAFKAAIATMKTKGGGRILVPPGVYRIDDDLLVDFSGLQIVAYGSGIVQLKQTSATEHGLNLLNCTSFYMEGINVTPTGASSGDGFRADGVSNVTIERCSFGGGWTHGLNFVNTCNRVNVARSSLDGDTVALRVQNAGSRFRIDKCAITGAGDGIRLNGSGAEYRIFDCGFTVAGIGLSCPTAGDTLNDIFVEASRFSTGTHAWNIAITAALNFQALNCITGTLLTVDASSVDLASASSLTLDGRYFYNVTGAVAINHIRINHLYRRQPVILKFASNPQVNHNAGAAPANHVPILLNGAAAFVTGADDTLSLIFDGSFYREVSRAVI